jgi:hypothetical protein
MNELIKDLARRATQEFSPAFERDKWQEKFAELIVRECMDIAANIGEHGSIAAQEMREVFGVEDA